MVADKFRPGDVRQPETPKQIDVTDKGQDVLKSEKKDINFTSHTIKPGETLSEICQQYGIPLKALYAVNQHTLDPKIVEKVDPQTKKTSIAYGAPTYHVGDKLNIPSDADVPNAVKYFDAWAKATVAKNRLEKPESPAEQKPGVTVTEKPISRTQILDDEHLAARSAALMVKVASETKYNQFRTQHEGQGGVDDAWDWMKTNLKIGDSSQEIERDFANQRGMVKVLEKAAKNQDLTQFKQLYQQCTGKAFEAKNFSSGYKKPAQLAFPDLAAQYDHSVQTGRKGARVALAAGVASLAVIPGAAPLALEGAHAIVVGSVAATAYGTMGGMLGDYANSGDITKVGEGAKEGAMVGGSIGVASTFGIAAQGRAAVAWGSESLMARVGTAAVGNVVTGGLAGGGIEGGLSAKEDLDTTGKINAEKTFKATVHGALIGGGTGLAIGVTAPLAEGAIAARAAGQAAARETAPELAGVATETAPTVASETAIAPKNLSQAFNKTAELPPQVPGKGTTQPSDVAKPTQTPTDASKGTTTQPSDVAKTTPDAPKDGTATWQKGSTQDVPATKKTIADDAAPQGTQDKTASTTQTDSSSTPHSDKDSGNWQQGSTHDMPASQKPDVSKYAAEVKKPPELTPEEVWQKKLDSLEKDPLVKPDSIKPLELQGGWKGVQYERKIGGRTVQESYNPKDGSRVHTEEFKDGMGIKHREVTTTSAAGQEVTNKFRVRQGLGGAEEWVPISNKWETHLNKLRHDKQVTDLEEIPMGNDWSKVRYEKSGQQIEEAVRGSDGASYKKVEYTDHRGVPNREVSTTSAEGKTVTNKFKLDQNGEWKFIFKDAGTKWTNDKFNSLRADSTVSNLREVQLKEGWKSVQYTDATGAKVTEAYNPVNGNTRAIREYEFKGQRFREDTSVEQNGRLTIFQKRKAVESVESKKARELDENAKPQYDDWFTEETKRTTALESGKVRIESSNAKDSHRLKVTEE